jgi:antitoxin component of MazEF toxin-antitoxin module
MMNKWTVTLEEDSEGNTVLPIPPELFEHHGWQEGDELDLVVENDVIILTNLSWKQRHDLPGKT